MRIAKLAAISVALLFALASAGTSEAQEHHLTLNAGGGFTPVTGQISNSLDNGWNIYFGGGYAFNSHFEADGEVGYNSFGLTSGLIAAAGTPGGNAHLWSFSVVPKFRLGRERRIDPYILMGVGYYRRTVNFTQPVLVPVTGFDPFFGFYSGLTTANQTLATSTDDGPGGSAGAGFDMKLGNSGLALFLEARYTYAATGNVPTRIVPLTLGIRW